MNTFELSKKAKEDLRQIAKYTEKRWGKTQRNLYLRQFDDGFHLLSESPFAGKACNFIAEGYRRFPIGSHIIFYKETTKNKITIIRILHQNMDVETRISDS